ncbi:hypothetical protein ACEQ8H_001753 [Pleosporales sp. CAS-2024a]
MSALEPQNTAQVPAAAEAQPAPAPVEPVQTDVPAEDALKTEEAKPEDDVAATVEEEKKEEKADAKPVEPIYSGALGYKAPGLKNAFRHSKKYFWFGDEAVPASNLREYLRGEKPEVAHSVAAWSSQTGKGLLYFVKHADQKEHPAGVLSLAYAADLHKDGANAFAFKISGSKHAFEAQTVAERDGWYLAVEKAIADAKEAKEAIESSEGYKEEKEKIGKPTMLAAAAPSVPKKSTDATPKAAETETPAAAGDEAVVAAPARTGSASSSDEETKAKKAKSKSRSVSRKRASIFGGLLGKKDKAEEKKEENKTEGEASKAQAEGAQDETTAVAEGSTAAPVITQEIPETSEELKAEADPAAAATTEEPKTEESGVKPVEEKPKPTKRASIFGSFFEKVKSPTHEKKEAEIVPPPISKDTEATPDASKPLEDGQVAATEPASEATGVKTDEVKPTASTPSKEKDHFKFGKLFGSKDRSKSPAPADKLAEPTKVDAVAPQIEEQPGVGNTSEAAEAVVAAPVGDAKPEPVVADKKRSSIFGSLGRSLSKAAKAGKENKKETVPPTTVPEASEPKEEAVAAPIAEEKEETPVAAPAEQSIGDVVPGAVTVGEGPKSAPIASTA